MRRLRRGSRRCGGQALVEFALLLPILIMIIMGIIEFGRLWMTMNVLTTAARGGARIAAVSALDQAEDRVESAVTNVLDAASISGATITLSGPDSENEVTVRVQIDYTVITGSIVPGLSGTFQLSRSAVMRWEG